jgi:rare lipoprotein A
MPITTGLLAYILLTFPVVGRGVQGPTKHASGHQVAPGKAKGGPPKVQYGIASFYADKFEGRKTYTDEIFTQDSLTGASNTLAMHTWVKVTNLHNHQFVYVRINDKMHPRNKRLIDLSRAAARQLGFTGKGLARVRVDVLGKKKPPEAKGEMAIRRPGQD